MELQGLTTTSYIELSHYLRVIRLSKPIIHAGLRPVLPSSRIFGEVISAWSPLLPLSAAPPYPAQSPLCLGGVGLERIGKGGAHSLIPEFFHNFFLLQQNNSA